MSENDLIAKYIKERFPEILNTYDFALYKFSYVCKDVVNSFENTFKNIDFNKISEQLKGE